MDDADRQLDRGLAHHAAGRFHDAEVIYRHVLTVAPHKPRAWYGLGMIAYEARQDADAVTFIQQAILRQPDNPEFYNGLSLVLQRLGKHEAAIECLQQALRFAPDAAGLYNNLAEAFKAQGDIPNALVNYQRAIEIKDDFLVARSNRLMAMNYDPHVSRSAMFHEHRRWSEIQQRSIQPQRQHLNQPDPERKLRLGYVSPDFREHAVARFVEPILRHHDRQQFDVWLYDSHPIDDATARNFRSLATGWRNMEGIATATAVDVIRRDGIDLLVDLAGHTAHHRLDVFAARPAPIQITYLGYPNTTGLDTIDYRLSDEVLDPPGEPTWSTEKTVRLPGGFCTFAPPSHAPRFSGTRFTAWQNHLWLTSRNPQTERGSVSRLARDPVHRSRVTYPLCPQLIQAAGSASAETPAGGPGIWRAPGGFLSSDGITDELSCSPRGSRHQP